MLKLALIASFAAHSVMSVEDDFPSDIEDEYEGGANFAYQPGTASVAPAVNQHSNVYVPVLLPVVTNIPTSSFLIPASSVITVPGVSHRDIEESPLDSDELPPLQCIFQTPYFFDPLEAAAQTVTETLLDWKKKSFLTACERVAPGAARFIEVGDIFPKRKMEQIEPIFVGSHLLFPDIVQRLFFTASSLDAITKRRDFSFSVLSPEGMFVSGRFSQGYVFLESFMAPSALHLFLSYLDDSLPLGVLGIVLDFRGSWEWAASSMNQLMEGNFRQILVGGCWNKSDGSLSIHISVDLPRVPRESRQDFGFIFGQAVASWKVSSSTVVIFKRNAVHFEDASLWYSTASFLSFLHDPSLCDTSLQEIQKEVLNVAVVSHPGADIKNELVLRSSGRSMFNLLPKVHHYVKEFKHIQAVAGAPHEAHVSFMESTFRRQFPFAIMTRESNTFPLPTAKHALGDISFRSFGTTDEMIGSLESLNDSQKLELDLNGSGRLFVTKEDGILLFSHRNNFGLLDASGLALVKQVWSHMTDMRRKVPSGVGLWIPGQSRNALEIAHLIQTISFSFFNTARKFSVCIPAELEGWCYSMEVEPLSVALFKRTVAVLASETILQGVNGGWVILTHSRKREVFRQNDMVMKSFLLNDYYSPSTTVTEDLSETLNVMNQADCTKHPFKIFWKFGDDMTHIVENVKSCLGKTVKSFFTMTIGTVRTLHFMVYGTYIIFFSKIHCAKETKFLISEIWRQLAMQITDIGFFFEPKDTVVTAFKKSRHILEAVPFKRFSVFQARAFSLQNVYSRQLELALEAPENGDVESWIYDVRLYIAELIGKKGTYSGALVLGGLQ